MANFQLTISGPRRCSHSRKFGHTYRTRLIDCATSSSCSDDQTCAFQINFSAGSRSPRIDVLRCGNCADYVDLAGIHSRRCLAFVSLFSLSLSCVCLFFKFFPRRPSSAHTPLSTPSAASAVMYVIKRNGQQEQVCTHNQQKQARTQNSGHSSSSGDGARRRRATSREERARWDTRCTRMRGHREHSGDQRAWMDTATLADRARAVPLLRLCPACCCCFCCPSGSLRQDHRAHLATMLQTQRIRRPVSGVAEGQHTKHAHNADGHTHSDSDTRAALESPPADLSCLSCVSRS